MTRRDQAARDAITVEIGYALCSALFAAALVYGAVAGPAFVFALPAPVERGLLFTAAALGSVLFVARVACLLWCFQQTAQPSQPGRTNPDS